MKKSKKKTKTDLDPEEKDLLSSVEKGEWQSIKSLDKEKKLARKAAIKSSCKQKNPR